MINLLDITTPECRKHNVIRLICKLWGRTTPKDIFYSTHSNHLQEWLFSLLQIEGAFQRLSRENPNAFKKIWEDIPDGWGDRDSCIKAALNTSSSWPSIENNFIRGNYPLSKINFPLLDLYVQMFEQNRGRIALSLGKKLGIPILGQAMEIPAKEYNFRHYPVYKFKTGALTKRFTHFQYADDSIVLPYPGKNYEEKDLFPLYHDYLIEANRQAAVFLVDSIPLAELKSTLRPSAISNMAHSCPGKISAVVGFLNSTPLCSLNNNTLPITKGRIKIAAILLDQRITRVRFPSLRIEGNIRSRIVSRE